VLISFSDKCLKDSWYLLINPSKLCFPRFLSPFSTSPNPLVKHLTSSLYQRCDDLESLCKKNSKCLLLSSMKSAYKFPEAFFGGSGAIKQAGQETTNASLSLSKSLYLLVHSNGPSASDPEIL